MKVSDEVVEVALAEFWDRPGRRTDMDFERMRAAMEAALPLVLGEPVAYQYTLEYGGCVANTKVSRHQLRYPFGVCGSDYLARNDDGVSYVRETPLYAPKEQQP